MTAARWVCAVIACSALATVSCSKAQVAAEAQEERRASAASPWVKARSPENLSLLEAPAKVLVPPGALGAVTVPFPGRVVKIHVRAGQTVAAGDPIADVAMVELVRAAAAYQAAGTRLAAYKKRQEQLEKLRADGLARLADLGRGGDADRLGARGSAVRDGHAARGGRRCRRGGGAARQWGRPRVAQPRGGRGARSERGARRRARRGHGAHRAHRGGKAGRVSRRASRTRLRKVRASRWCLRRGRRSRLHLVATSPVVESSDGTVRTWFEPENEVNLPHGAACRLRVLVDPAAGVVAVPAKAVGLRNGKAVVLTKKSEAPVEVVVLATSGADALIKGPIAPGDEVAAECPLAPAEGEP